jgi:hypothetical protein
VKRRAAGLTGSASPRISQRELETKNRGAGARALLQKAAKNCRCSKELDRGRASSARTDGRPGEVLAPRGPSAARGRVAAPESETI